jgi:hypothetical protein
MDSTAVALVEERHPPPLAISLVVTAAR